MHWTKGENTTVGLFSLFHTGSKSWNSIFSLHRQRKVLLSFEAEDSFFNNFEPGS